MPFHGYAQNNQWCVVWRRVGQDHNGPVVSEVAEEFECNLVEEYREVTGADGQPVGSDMTVGGLPETVPVGSALWPGRIQDLTGAIQTPMSNVFRVVGSVKHPDARGRDYDVELFCARAADRLPAQGDE